MVELTEDMIADAKAQLEGLRPQPASLPPVGREPILEATRKFAYEVLLYAAANKIDLTPGDGLREASVKVTLWHYGLGDDPQFQR